MHTFVVICSVVLIMWVSNGFMWLNHINPLETRHDDVIKWKLFPRYWPFVRGIRRLPVNSPHKGQWRGALKFSLISAWKNGWVNNRDVGDLRHYRAHYDVTVMEVNLKDIGRIGRYLSTTKHSKTWTVCIFLGMYLYICIYIVSWICLNSLVPRICGCRCLNFKFISCVDVLIFSRKVVLLVVSQHWFR